MKKAIGILFLPLLFGGLVSCTKSDSAPTLTQPSFVIDGKTINLNGISMAHLYDTGDSLIVINSNTTDSAAFNSIQIGNNTSMNYAVILIGANNSLKVGTYISTQTNLNMLILGLQYQNLYYTGGRVPTGATPGICTVNITSLSDSTVSGNYSGTVYNTNGGMGLLTKTVRGSFKANLL